MPLPKDLDGTTQRRASTRRNETTYSHKDDRRFEVRPPSQWHPPSRPRDLHERSAGRRASWRWKCKSQAHTWTHRPQEDHNEMGLTNETAWTHRPQEDHNEMGLTNETARSPPTHPTRRR